jgi:hypothetical protein
MADMRRTLKVIHFASQLCGISPYGSFLRNDGYENPVLCRKLLLYSFILFIATSVGQTRFVIGIFRESNKVSSAAYSVNLRILLIFGSCMLTTYVIWATSRLIGQRNFFKISHKLLSVSSFVNYREGTVFSNAVIALHFVLFVTSFLRYVFVWTRHSYQIDTLHNYISGMIFDTVTSFAAVQFLYLVFTLRRHFMLLNSSLNEVVVSTVKSECVLSLKVRTVSDLFPETYSVISGVSDILYRHMMLCDVLELINPTYSFQVLALIGSKFVYPTICFHSFFSVFDRSIFSSSFLYDNHTAWQFRSTALCYGGVFLQVCQFSGAYYLNTLH